MRQFRTIWKMMRGPYDPMLDSFEGLALAYGAHPQEVHSEFIRRLHRLVFQAAESYARRRLPISTPEDSAELTRSVFAEFAPEFGSGLPGSLLRRFARAIRRVLDDEAFSAIAYLFYCQLPIYELCDPEQQKLMAAAYEDGPGPHTIDVLSMRFNLSRDRTKAILSAGHQALKLVIKDEFGPSELTLETEGYLP